MLRAKSHSFVGIICALLFLAGCGSDLPASQTTPSITDSAKAELVDFIAESIAPQFLDERDTLIAYTIVKDETNLWFGNSTEEEDMQRCWVHTQAGLSECTSDDLTRAFHPSQASPEMPRIFFAIAYDDSPQVLVILDIYTVLPSTDNMDGYRFVFEYQDATWQEVSWTKVY